MAGLDNLMAFIWRDPRANNCNTYLIDGRAPLLIDPGHSAFIENIAGRMEESGFNLPRLALAVCTHGHPDHAEGAEVLAEIPVPVAIHETEEPCLKDMARLFYTSQGQTAPEPRFDFLLREGDLMVGDNTFEVLHTPGHTPGSICLYWPAEKALFTGDLLFEEGVGRTDFPGGDALALKESVRRVQSLDIEWILPGHGEIIQGREAVRENFDFIGRFIFSTM
jgi:glyoxylase-like metal-dependent hydrolase (beta-lactamase superfamily II)